ncbi:hypothetical protein HK104_005726 [Borealophlyctis nickersoniae]|nr:hypothetical protein HK104_005726 [Borealophlyctis nickersoniae]
MEGGSGSGGGGFSLLDDFMFDFEKRMQEPEDIGRGSRPNAVEKSRDAEPVKAGGSRAVKETPPAKVFRLPGSNAKSTGYNNSTTVGDDERINHSELAEALSLLRKIRQEDPQPSKALPSAASAPKTNGFNAREWSGNGSVNPTRGGVASADESSVPLPRFNRRARKQALSGDAPKPKPPSPQPSPQPPLQPSPVPRSSGRERSSSRSNNRAAKYAPSVTESDSDDISSPLPIRAYMSDSNVAARRGQRSTSRPRGLEYEGALPSPPPSPGMVRPESRAGRSRTPVPLQGMEYGRSRPESPALSRANSRGSLATSYNQNPSSGRNTPAGRESSSSRGQVRGHSYGKSRSRSRSRHSESSNSDEEVALAAIQNRHLEERSRSRGRRPGRNRSIESLRSARSGQSEHINPGGFAPPVDMLPPPPPDRVMPQARLTPQQQQQMALAQQQMWAQLYYQQAAMQQRAMIAMQQQQQLQQQLGVQSHPPHQPYPSPAAGGMPYPAPTGPPLPYPPPGMLVPSSNGMPAYHPMYGPMQPGVGPVNPMTGNGMPAPEGGKEKKKKVGKKKSAASVKSRKGREKDEEMKMEAPEEVAVAAA